MGASTRSTGTAPKELPPLLEEFRSALQDEIEVTKRHASNSALPLSNGHQVGHRGGAFQYAFLIDTVLNTPDGAPGDLVLPGKPPLAVTIVSIEGLRIVLSVESDLGTFVPHARLQTNPAFLMRKLIERIESKASETNSAGRRMLGLDPVSGTPVTFENHTTLNEAQRCALGNALGRNLTVIWGPPGTGKTYTIGTIVEHLSKRSRSVLIVSHTNVAVDQAVKHVAKAMPKEDLRRGTIVRVGEVRDQELESDYPDVLLKRQVELQSQELLRQRETLLLRLDILNEEWNRLQEQVSMAKWVQSAETEIRSWPVTPHRLTENKRGDRKTIPMQ